MTDDVSITLPDWIEPELNKHPEVFPILEDRMRLVISFSKMNIANQTGGPFAAGVFETKTGKLVSLGVNRVVPLGLSIAHAEIVALSFAQKKLGFMIWESLVYPNINLLLTGAHASCVMVLSSGQVLHHL